MAFLESVIIFIQTGQWVDPRRWGGGGLPPNPALARMVRRRSGEVKRKLGTIEEQRRLLETVLKLAGPPGGPGGGGKRNDGRMAVGGQMGPRTSGSQNKSPTELRLGFKGSANTPPPTPLLGLVSRPHRRAMGQPLSYLCSLSKIHSRKHFCQEGGQLMVRSGGRGATPISGLPPNNRVLDLAAWFHYKRCSLGKGKGGRS